MSFSKFARQRRLFDASISGCRPSFSPHSPLLSRILHLSIHPHLPSSISSPSPLPFLWIKTKATPCKKSPRWTRRRPDEAEGERVINHALESGAAVAAAAAAVVVRGELCYDKYWEVEWAIVLSQCGGAYIPPSTSSPWNVALWLGPGQRAVIQAATVEGALWSHEQSGTQKRVINCYPSRGSSSFFSLLPPDLGDA